MFAEIMIASLAKFSDTSFMRKWGQKPFPYYNDVTKIIYGKKDSVSDTKPSLFIDIDKMEKLGDNYFRIESFRSLKKGWDGYSAEIIPETILNRVQDILLKVRKPSSPRLQVFPTGRGTVQIEYYIDDDNQTEIEVFQNQYNAFIVSKGMEEEKRVTRKEAITILDNIINGK